MAEDVTFTNCYCCYITNNPYQYPSAVSEEQNNRTQIQTGWHPIPCILWSHFVTPKEWAEFQIKYEAYTVKGYKIKLFNMIPMTTQLAFGANQVYTAFNNCIYAVGYQDDFYETSWENWYLDDNRWKQPHLAFKEGMYFDSTAPKRFMLPQYTWEIPNFRYYNQWSASNSNQNASGVFPTAGFPTGLFWDPFNHPKSILEFRPGKNAITFSWERHACDADKWFNLDRVAWWHPYKASGPYTHISNRPEAYELTKTVDPDRLTSEYENSTKHVHDYTIPNWYDLPIVPNAWFWHEMRASIIQDFDKRKPDLFFPGTEKEQYMYPPRQCFVKVMPLIDDHGTTIPITAQISVQVELFCAAKPRKSAIYAPTWGPFAWPQLYSIHTEHKQFAESRIRYRTGGMRRTWQNWQRTVVPASGPGQGTQEDAWQQAHAREDPYNFIARSGPQLNPSGSGVGGTRSTPIYTMANNDVPYKRHEIHINIDNKDGTRAVQTTVSRLRHALRKTPEPDEIDMV